MSTYRSRHSKLNVHLSFGNDVSIILLEVSNLDLEIKKERNSVSMPNLKQFLFKNIPSRVDSIRYPPVKRPYNFFGTFRPLAILCKLLGAFSLQNVVQSNGHLVRYCFNSKDVLWGPILHSILLVLQFLYEQDPWLRFQFPYIVSRTVLIFVTFLNFDRFLPQLILYIETFDDSCSEIESKLKKEWLCHGRTWVFTSIVCYIICLSGIIIEKYFFTPPWLGIVMAFVTLLPLYVRALYTNMFMFFCCNLTERFKIIRGVWKKILDDCGVGSYIGRGERQLLVPGKRRDGSILRPERQLERVRLLHCHLVATCQQLNTCYGVLIALYFLTIFVEMLADLYQFIYLAAVATSSQIIYSFYNVLTLFFIVNFAGNLTEASQDIVQDLGGIPMSMLSGACQGQVQMFLSYLSANKVEVNAAGFCIVNRGTLVSILIYMTTYIVVIVEFAPELKKITPFNSTRQI